MSFNIFSEFPAFYLALNNYFPFTPDAGIYCGGYQGPLYPNPMSLILPSIGFNPLPFQNPVASNYQMISKDDVYAGLGIGNPGINYRNPGHLLGLLDTYGRMSYGLNILLAIRSLSTSSNPGPAVDISLPLTIQLLDGSVNTTLSIEDIYPSFSETPDSYLSSFVNGSLLIDPRISNKNPFVFNDDEKHEPETSQINLFSLFGNISIDSYRNMPEIFQSFIDDMIDYINFFMAIEAVGSTSPMPFGESVKNLPRLFPPADGFPNFENSTVEFSDGQQTKFRHKIESLTKTDALKLMTGSENFHRIDSDILEYRSLTELNCIINLIPIQTFAVSYAFLTSSTNLPIFITDNNITVDVSQQRYFVLYSITDILINILNLNDDKEVSINGSATYDYQSPLSTIFDNEVLPYLSRQFIFSYSNTNKFTWDRSWFNLNESDNIELLSLEKTINSIDSEIFDFNETIELFPGNNCIRAKLLTQTTVFADTTFNNLDNLNINLNISTSNLDLSHEFSMEGTIS